MTSHRVSCHCGNIAFEVEGDPGKVLQCNCSICQRKGSLLWFVPRESVRFVSNEGVRTYRFNRHLIAHHFCGTCGIAPYSEATDPKGQPVVAINARCLEDLDPAQLEVTFHDGRSK